jgi:polar amino acid transport system substrate-binding protein
MKQVLQDSQGLLEIAELPEPLPPASGVLVQNRFSLISPGTERAMVQMAQQSLLAKARARPDLARQVLDRMKTEGVWQTVRKVKARLGQPVPLGYSCAGVVVASTCPAFSPGQRVACAGFGHASHAGFVSVPQNLTVLVPDAVSDRAAATVTIGAIAMQGVRQADPKLGETVVVIGLGLLGQITTMLLAASGCRVIGYDVSHERVRQAKECGAIHADIDVHPEAALALTGGRGADVVIITAASRQNGPIELAAALCRDRGRIVVVGDVKTDLPRPPFYHKELELRFARSYGPGRYDRHYEEEGHDYPYGYVRWTEQRNMAAYLDLLAQGKVSVERLITHTFPIDEAAQAYNIVAGRTSEPYLGILLSYPEDAPRVGKLVLRKPRAQKRGRLRVGFIGAGQFATGVLLPHLKATGAELVTISSRTGLSARAAAKRYDFSQVAADPELIFSDVAIDLVFVVTPHDEHAALAVAAIAAGKAVFVEKPLAVNRGQLDRVAQAYQEHGHPLMVGFNRRFAPLTERMREHFGSDSHPVAIDYRVLAGALPADSQWQSLATGGRIVGELCHFIDFCRFMAGAPISRVTAECALSPESRLHPPDNLQVLLKFANGSVATISYVARAHTGAGKEEVTVMGQGRTAVLHDFTSLALHGPRGSTDVRRRQDKGHRDELMRVVECLKAGEPMPIPFEELHEVTRATFAVQDALATGEKIAM